MINIHHGGPPDFRRSEAGLEQLDRADRPLSFALDVASAWFGSGISPYPIGGHLNVRLGDGLEISLDAGRESAPIPTIRAFPRPIRPQVHRPREVAGRDDESRAVREHAVPGQVVVINGDPGSGRTTMLHALAHADWQQRFPDGVIYLDAADVHPDDLAQLTFEALYLTDTPFRPAPERLAELLSNDRVLLLVDGADAHVFTALPWLSSAMPDAAIVAATRDPYELGHTVTLAGLPVEAAMHMVTPMPGTADEHSADAIRADAIRRIATALRGHPADLRIAAALLREGTFTPDGLASWLAGGAAARSSLVAALVRTLPAEARDVLDLLATVDTRATRQHVAAIIGHTEAEEGLRVLRRANLLTADTPYVRLDSSLAHLVRGTISTGPWRDRVLDHLVDWVARNANDTDRLLADASLLQRATRDAVARGRYAAVASLARVLSPALAQTARWGARGAVLSLAVEAGRHLGGALSHWAHEQLGTTTAHPQISPHPAPGGHPQPSTGHAPSPGHPAHGDADDAHVPDQHPSPHSTHNRATHNQATNQPTQRIRQAPSSRSSRDPARLPSWKTLAVAAAVVTAISATWVVFTGILDNQQLALAPTPTPIGQAALFPDNGTETTRPPGMSTAEPTTNTTPGPTSSAMALPPVTSSASKTTLPGTAAPATPPLAAPPVPPPGTPPPPPSPPPTPPPTYTLLMYLTNSSSGTIDVVINDIYVGSCMNTSDGSTQDCSYSMQAGDEVSLNPIDYVDAWGAGPCQGTSTSAACVFSATANTRFALSVSQGGE